MDGALWDRDGILVQIGWFIITKLTYGLCDFHGLWFWAIWGLMMFNANVSFPDEMPTQYSSIIFHLMGSDMLFFFPKTGIVPMGCPILPRKQKHRNITFWGTLLNLHYRLGSSTKTKLWIYRNLTLGWNQQFWQLNHVITDNPIDVLFSWVVW